MSNTFTCKTICVNCKYFIDKTRESNQSEQIWYNLFCACPAVLGNSVQDPVTGKRMFVSASGRMDDHLPYARDINKNGDCEHYSLASPRKDGPVDRHKYDPFDANRSRRYRISPQTYADVNPSYKPENKSFIVKLFEGLCEIFRFF